MRYWICGGEGTTGGHRTKASDLKSCYSPVTQESPIYIHTGQKRNIRINSIKKSRDLKSSALICPQCNNARTAAHDCAWAKLSTYLRNKNPTIKKGEIIRLDKAFPGSVRRSMLGVHLYFVKLFGRAVVAHNIPVEIKPFSDAIMLGKAHEKLCLAFWSGKGLGAGHSNLEMDNIAGRCVYATWFYIIGSVAVNIIYAEPSERRKGMVNAWKPGSVTKRVRVGGV